MTLRENTAPTYLNQPILPSIDGLRAISIILVIFSHIFADYEVVRKSQIGPIGVEIFFVISGFLITTLLLKEKNKTGKINLKYFYIRRCLRILPPVYLFLIVLFLLNIIFTLEISKTSFLASFVFLRNLPLKGTNDWYTGHFWSLGIEEQFYLVFPFLLAAVNPKRYVILVGLVIVFLPLISHLGYNNIGPFYSNRVVHNITFTIINLWGINTALILIGSVLAIFTFYNGDLFRKLMKYRYLSIAVFALALVLRLPTLNMYIPFLSQILFGLLIGACIILNLEPRNFFGIMLNNKLMVKIGVLSYSIYIWQQLFTHNQPWSDLSGFWTSVTLNILALALTAFLSYYFFEKRFIKLRNHFKA